MSKPRGIERSRKAIQREALLRAGHKPIGRPRVPDADKARYRSVSIKRHKHELLKARADRLHFLVATAIDEAVDWVLAQPKYGGEHPQAAILDQITVSLDRVTDEEPM